MAGHFFTTIEDNVTGRPVVGASLEVYTASATVVGDEVTSGTYATIYSDDGVTSIDQTIAVNRPTSDSRGFVEFWTNENSVVLEISYGGSAKKAITDVEITGGSVNSDVTALAARVDNHDALLGTTANAQDLGTFTGSTISDNSSVLNALQELETAVEAGSSSGDVTASGLTMNTARILGRTTASTGSIEELTAAQVQSFISMLTAASAANVWTGTSTTTALTPAALFSSAAIQTLTDGATITPDFGAGLNFKVTLGGNRTLANPSNAKEGQSGIIVVTQDGTGSRTLAYGSNWRFPGGSATGGVLSTAANAVDQIAYIVRAGGIIHAVMTKAFAA